MEEEKWVELVLEPRTAKSLVNKYFGRHVPMYPNDKVYVSVEEGVFNAPIKIERPEDLEILFNAITSFCSVEKRYDSGHPLGRGWVIFNCGAKKVEVEIHGDWPGMSNYVKVRVAR